MSAGFHHLLHPYAGDDLLDQQRERWLGQFAHVLHIRSWEIGRIKIADFRNYVACLKDYNRPDEG